MRPPELPADFWATSHMREALTTWNMGQVIAAYRAHPHHGRPVPQEIVAGWVGITQAQLSRIENGPPIKDLDKLIHWARTLGVPSDLLWFALPEEPSLARAETLCPPTARHRSTAACNVRKEAPETDDMNRRDLLRVLSVTGPLMAMAGTGESAEAHRLDVTTLDEYAALNSHLWRVFALSRTKSSAFPMVREQLDVLMEALERSSDSTTHGTLCGFVSDLLQLAGEILFDCRRYTDAAHCYTLAATAGKEAGAYDLWACALTRHSFIGMCEGRFSKVAPMLELAAMLAGRGDGELSTRYWVSTVQASVFAGLGDLYACQQALDRAEGVGRLSSRSHNGGWLRFDGSRLPEERGGCFVTLGRTDLAEVALNDALGRNLSARRRGSVLVDLARLGTQRGDVDQVVTHAQAVLEIARETGSGFVAGRLRGLQPGLVPLLTEHGVRQLNQEIEDLVGTARQ